MSMQLTSTLCLTAEQAARLDWSGLPPVCLELREALGVEAAAVLLVRYAGRDRLYVPRAERMGEEHELVKLLGVEAAIKLARFADGVPVVMPTGKRFMRQMVFQHVMEQRREGKSWTEIQDGLVVEVKMSQRALRDIGNHGVACACGESATPRPQVEQRTFWRELG